jgi:hypothetical protein
MSLDALLGQVFNSGVALELGGGLDFADGLQAVYDTANKRIKVIAVGGGSGGGGHTIANEGTPLPARSVLNFVGVNVNVTDGGAETTVTISGPTTAYVDAGDVSTLAAAASLIPVAGGAPVAVNLAGVAGASGSDSAWARRDHVHPITGQLPTANIADRAITVAKLPAIATDTLLGRDSAGTGDVEVITLDPATLQMNGAGALRIPDQLGARGTLNVILDLYPSVNLKGTLATSSTVNFDVAIVAGKVFSIYFDMFVDDGSAGPCKLCKAIKVMAHQVAGAVVQETKDVAHSSALSGWTFDGAISGTNYRFSLNNASGVTGTYRLLGGFVRSDKPS